MAALTTGLLITLLGLIACAAIIPAVLFLFNLRRYQSPRTGRTSREHVAILIPARNEAANIAACVESALLSADIDASVWVCDDNSTDATATIVQTIAARDPRVHLLQGSPLPRGWNGKQAACWKLARHAANEELLLFLDADVRLHRWTVARAVRMLRDGDVALLSGFPRQRYSGLLDRLLLPLIHFVLLSYLPLRWMDTTTDPRFAAGCGQFMLIDRSAYFASGGHAEIRASRHDGLLLPRLLREHGFGTGLADITRLADVHMYTTARDTWNGLLKNATEGMAAPSRIVPFSLLLFFGSVVPGVLFYLLLFSPLIAIQLGSHGIDITATNVTAATALAILAISASLASVLPRLIACHRFKQPLWSALLHPLGVALLLILQWQAWLRERFGRPVDWRTRTYSTDTGSETTHR